MAVSLLGDGVTLVTLAWQVYALSNAPAALSLVGVAMTVPHVALLLVGGAVSDRFDRRRVMIAADAARAVTLAAIGLLAVTGSLRLWHLLPLIAVYGAATAFFGPAFDALVPDVVEPAQLTQANAIDQFARPAALRLAGPALGGALIAVAGSGVAFLLDALTFVVSIACLLRVRPRVVGDQRLATAAVAADHAAAADAADGGRRPSMRRDLGDGFRYVRGHVWLWGTFLAATFAYLLFMGPVEVLLPWIVKNELAAGPGTLGLVFAVGGVGALGAALAVGRFGVPRRTMTFIYCVWAASTLVLAGYGLARVTWQVMAVSFVFNALESAGTVVWLTTKQRLVPRHYLGRVSSFDWFISIGLVPVSFALTAPVAAAIGARATFVVAGVLGSAVTLAFLFLPGMRRVDASDRSAAGAAPQALPVEVAA
jgi:MFS family permease